MKRWIMGLLVLGLVNASALWADGMGVKSKAVTLQGTLVDLACYFDDGDSGDDHMGMKGCGKACLKQGSPAGLVVGSQVYFLLFPAANFADYVGKTLQITGDLYGADALIPSKAALVSTSGNQPLHWSVKPMM